MTKHIFRRYGIIDGKVAFIYKKNEEELKKSILKWKSRANAVGIEGLMKRHRLMKNISKASHVLENRKTFSSLFRFFNTISESGRSSMRLRHVERLGSYMLEKRLEERERKREMQFSI